MRTTRAAVTLETVEPDWSWQRSELVRTWVSSRPASSTGWRTAGNASCARRRPPLCHLDARRTTTSETFTATATTTIDASPETVWEALTPPDVIEQDFFGATVVTDWEVGSPIVSRGEWEGESYEDRGEILRFEPAEALAYSHWSPLSGVPDVPENYHTDAFDLTPADGGTEPAITQDNDDSEAARDHAEQNWELVLGNLKELLER